MLFRLLRFSGSWKLLLPDPDPASAADEPVDAAAAPAGVAAAPGAGAECTLGCRCRWRRAAGD